MNKPESDHYSILTIFLMFLCIHDKVFDVCSGIAYVFSSQQIYEVTGLRREVQNSDAAALRNEGRKKQNDVRVLLRQEVCVVVVVGQLVQEGPRLQDESGQNHLGQVHAWPDLLQQGPDQGFVLLRYGLCLSSFARLQGQTENPTFCRKTCLNLSLFFVTSSAKTVHVHACSPPPPPPEL